MLKIVLAPFIATKCSRRVLGKPRARKTTYDRPSEKHLLFTTHNDVSYTQISYLINCSKRVLCVFAGKLVVYRLHFLFFFYIIGLRVLRNTTHWPLSKRKTRDKNIYTYIMYYISLLEKRPSHS